MTHFVGTDVQPLIDLYRVCTDDFPIQLLSQRQRKLSLANSSWSSQHDDPGEAGSSTCQCALGTIWTLGSVQLGTIPSESSPLAKDGGSFV